MRVKENHVVVIIIVNHYQKQSPCREPVSSTWQLGVAAPCGHTQASEPQQFSDTADTSCGPGDVQSMARTAVHYSRGFQPDISCAEDFLHCFLGDTVQSLDLSLIIFIPLFLFSYYFFCSFHKSHTNTHNTVALRCYLKCYEVQLTQKATRCEASSLKYYQSSTITGQWKRSFAVYLQYEK